jgi:hypothetical protein
MLPSAVRGPESLAADRRWLGPIDELGLVACCLEVREAITEKDLGVDDGGVVDDEATSLRKIQLWVVLS